MNKCVKCLQEIKTYRLYGVDYKGCGCDTGTSGLKQANEFDLSKLLQESYEERVELLKARSEIAMDKLNEHFETLSDQLKEKAEELKRQIAGSFHIRSLALDTHADSLMQAMEKKAMEISAAEMERTTTNRVGWVDFDPNNTKELIDDQNYLIRYRGMNGQWRCPHIADWDEYEQQFMLLHTSSFMYPIVHQYFKITE